MARLLHVSLAMWMAAAEQNCGRAAGRRSEKRAEQAAALERKYRLPAHVQPTFFKARGGGNNNNLRGKSTAGPHAAAKRPAATSLPHGFSSFYHTGNI
jgi:hypothetical protein